MRFDNTSKVDRKSGVRLGEPGAPALFLLGFCQDCRQGRLAAVPKIGTLRGRGWGERTAGPSTSLRFGRDDKGREGLRSASNAGRENRRSLGFLRVSCQASWFR
jgi:hypothetical protein